jgi:hypothetical protein
LALATVLAALAAPVMTIAPGPAGAAAMHSPSHPAHRLHQASRSAPTTPTATTTALQPANPAFPGIAIARAPFDLPDPFLLRVGNSYDMFLSSAFNNTQNVPVLIGRPGHWTADSVDAVPTLPAWAAGQSTGQPVWSPAVYKIGSSYVMYLAPEIAGSRPLQHCIGIATAPDPVGPFQVAPEPFICQRAIGGDIDPQLFVDPAGPGGPAHPDYLIWKSDNNSTPGAGIPTIWAQPISNNGRHLMGQPARIFTPDQPWEHTLIEAPQMTLSPDGQVWLFFSAGVGYYSSDYGMGAVHCDGPLGPCDASLPAPLITTNFQGAGPGEETYFVGPDGSDWLLYSPVHTGDGLNVLRPVEAARVGWDSSGPFMARAGRFPSPGAGA